MSRQITYSLIADGETDRMLVPILQWAIHRLDPTVEILEPEFVRRSGTIVDFLHLYVPTSMLVFVHRDAENATLEDRLTEFANVNVKGLVPVIPVRMSEAWVLFDGAAIARAAGRPTAVVSAPSISTLEAIVDPKQELETLLLCAAGNPTGRRRKTFKKGIGTRRVSVATYITDYSPLESLTAFQEFQTSLETAYPYHHHPTSL